MTEPTHNTIVMKGRLGMKGNWIDDASRFLIEGRESDCEAGPTGSRLAPALFELRAYGHRWHCDGYAFVPLGSITVWIRLVGAPRNPAPAAGDHVAVRRRIDAPVQGRRVPPDANSKGSSQRLHDTYIPSRFTGEQIDDGAGGELRLDLLIDARLPVSNRIGVESSA